MKFIRKIFLKLAYKNCFLFRNMSNKAFRNKPFIVICGCTGTGKTKLSIELAEWLIKDGKKCEIVNGDAMQLYKNLDIITNKVRKEEMKDIKHHLIGYLDSNYINYNVIDYRNVAVELIDNLLENDIIPILVGGTHYYIQSIIWELLIDKNYDDDLKNKRSNIPENVNSEILNLISESNEFLKKDSSSRIDINVKLHDSEIKTETIYNELARVDLQSAQKIHPNDRRKLCRALQIFYTFGQTKTDLLDSRKNEKGTNYPLRYKNISLFMMNCENQKLNERLDDRVDQMILKGMLTEIESFRKRFEELFPDETFKSYSRNYEFGIFQSIGLKEFDDYFNYLKSEKSLDETLLSKLFDKAVLDMKLATKRYARTQIRWIRNRFVKKGEKISPIIHELDTTDITNWNDHVFNKAKDIFYDYLKRYELDNQIELNNINNSIEDLNHFQFNKCEICEKIFINKFQWESHLNGSKHKKRLKKSKKKDR